MNLDIPRRFGAPAILRSAAAEGGGAGAAAGSTPAAGATPAAASPAAAGGSPGGAAPPAGGATPPAGGATSPAGSATPPAGGAAPPWHASLGLDKDTADWIEGHRFADAKTALASARHFEKVARDRNVMARPDPEKIAEWDGWREIGWKPDRKDYTVEPVKPKRGGEADAGLHAAVLDAAHAARVPLDQAKAVYGAVVGYIDAMLDRVEAAGAQSRRDLAEALRTEWGTEEAYARNVELAKRAMRTLGIGAQDAAVLEQAVSAPGLVRAFHQLGTMLGEANLVGLDGSAGGVMGKAEAQAELNRLQGDRAFLDILNDPRHPQQADYKARRQRLIDRIAMGR